MNYKSQHALYKTKIDEALKELVESIAVHSKELRMSMDYSLFPGGKRLRPLLFLAVYSGLYGKDEKEGLPLACAIELIHTYSLIHDDLPSMDDDDYRRGKLTNHKVFGESTAILTGDALLNLSYEIMLDNARQHPENVSSHLEAISDIARASGIKGMIGGQLADLNLQWKTNAKDTLDFICKGKTAALIQTSIVSAAILAKASKAEIRALARFGELIGMAFQIIDDVLDFDSESLNVECGQDCGKLTYPIVYGIEGSKEMAKNLIDEALRELEIFDIDKYNEGYIFLSQTAVLLSGRTE